MARASTLRVGSIGAAWMLAGGIVVLHSAVQYIHPAVGARTRAEFPGVSNRLRSSRTGVRCEPNQNESLGPTTAISGIPVMFLAVGIALSGYITATTVNTPQHHDTKGVFHAYRARSQTADKLPIFQEFIQGDTERIKTAQRVKGSIFHEMTGHLSEKKAIAFHTGCATLGTAAVAACFFYPNQDRLTSLVSNKGNQEELNVGSVYESKDAENNWWAVKVDAKNGDGSYKCTSATKESTFNASPPGWDKVMPCDCRRVIRGDRVMAEFSNCIN